MILSENSEIAQFAMRLLGAKKKTLTLTNEDVYQGCV